MKRKEWGKRKREKNLYYCTNLLINNFGKLLLTPWWYATQAMEVPPLIEDLC